MDISQLVEPDRVHRSVYTDQEIFDQEIENIFEKVWVYCGHESQVPNAGDFYTVTIGRQPMVMIRDHDGDCLLYTSPSPRDLSTSRMPSSA